MCKLMKWNPSLLLAILPSIRYFKIERENFRVPRRGVTGKKFFYKLQRLFLSPACYLRLFICFFALYYYKQANKGERKHLVKCFIIWGQTSWHRYENAASWEPKVGKKFSVQQPFKFPFEAVCRSPSSLLSRVPQFFQKSIVFNYSTANDVFL